MFGYTSKTVSYAEELTLVSIYYSQGNGFNNPLSRLLRNTGTRNLVLVVLVAVLL